MEKKFECPKCGAKGNHPFIKSWLMQGRVQGKRQTDTAENRFNVVRVSLFRCLSCGKLFRRGESIKKKEAKT